MENLYGHAVGIYDAGGMRQWKDGAATGDGAGKMTPGTYTASGKESTGMSPLKWKWMKPRF